MPAQEPSLREIMVATQGLQGTLEPKLDAVMTEVNLLCASVHYIVEKDSTVSHK